MSTNNHLRSEKMAQAYNDLIATGILEKSCPLCDKQATQTFKYWKIVPNDFPYDLIAERHDMIVPIHHKNEQEFSEEERNELSEIKNSVLQEYDVIVEATHRAKSIPDHFHLHLINTKK